MWAGWRLFNATRFSHNRTACKNCGADPRSAAGPLAGLPVVDETDPVGEERVQGDNLLLWHLLFGNSKTQFQQKYSSSLFPLRAGKFE